MDNNFDSTPHMNPYGVKQPQMRSDGLPPLPTGMPTGPIAGPIPTPSPFSSPTGYPMEYGMRPTPTPTPYTPAPGVYQPTAFPTTDMGDLTPLTPFNQPIPVTTQTMLYLNGFLRSMIGRRVTVDFLIGTNTLTDRTGTLLAVGANYIVINEVETDDILVCDFFSIKFVKVYY